MTNVDIAEGIEVCDSCGHDFAIGETYTEVQVGGVAWYPERDPDPLLAMWCMKCARGEAA